MEGCQQSQGFSQQSPHLMLATTRRMIRIRMMRMMSMVSMVRMVRMVRICEFSEEDEDRTAIRTSFWFDCWFCSVGTWFFLISFLVKVMITRCPRPVSCISWIKEWELIRSGLAEQAFGISLVTCVGGFHADLVVRFLTPKSWTDLGGSKHAAEYLGDVDEEGVQGKEKINQKSLSHEEVLLYLRFEIQCVLCFLWKLFFMRPLLAPNLEWFFSMLLTCSRRRIKFDNALLSEFQRTNLTKFEISQHAEQTLEPSEGQVCLVSLQKLLSMLQTD